MKWAELSVEALRDALRIYATVAYPRGLPDQWPSFLRNENLSLDRILTEFRDEGRKSGGRRIVLRLGNDEYPFMKFVLEEHLFQGEFTFGVDCHDEMFLPGGEEATRVERLRAHNAEVRARIEARWREAGIPGPEHLVELAEAVPPLGESKGVRLLVVDDTECAARALSALLRRRGFDVDVVRDGAAAVDTADPRRHQGIVMDVDMPVMNGVEATRRLKADPNRADIPILLATAGELDPRSAGAADAFLQKPFPVEILLSFLDHLTRPPRDS